MASGKWPAFATATILALFLVDWPLEHALHRRWLDKIDYERDPIARNDDVENSLSKSALCREQSHPKMATMSGFIALS